MSQEKIILLAKGLVVGSALIGYKAALFSVFYKRHKGNVMQQRHKKNLKEGGDK